MDIANIAGQVWIVIQVLLIDIIMSSDNVFVISMTTQQLKHRDKIKAMIGGAIGAGVLRIVFAMFLVQFLENPIIKLIGAVLLCIICVKLYVEIRNNQPKKSQQHSGTTFWHAIWLIIVADVSMSLDNVLAVSAVIDHSAWLLIPSIIISVILMTTLASQLQKRIKRYPLIQWIGFTMIVIIAIKLLMASVSMLLPVSYYNIVVSSTMMIMMIAAMVLHHYYLTPLETKQLHPRFKHHASLIIMILLTIIALFIGYGDFIIMRLGGRPYLAQGVIIVIFLLLLELISIQKIPSVSGKLPK